MQFPSEYDQMSRNAHALLRYLVMNIMPLLRYLETRIVLHYLANMSNAQDAIVLNQSINVKTGDERSSDPEGSRSPRGI